jgi:hypothetical protein
MQQTARYCRFYSGKYNEWFCTDGSKSVFDMGDAIEIYKTPTFSRVGFCIWPVFTFCTILRFADFCHAPTKPI